MTLLMVALSSCISVGDKPQELGVLPSRSDGSQNVLVTRKSRFGGGATSMFLTVDGVDIAKLRNGDSVKFGLESGNYVIGIRCNSSSAPGFLEWVHHVLVIGIRNDSTEMSIAVEYPGCAIY